MKVLITGASRGIGRAAGERLARAGHEVVAGVRDDAAAQEVERAGLRPVRLDVTDGASIAAAAAEIGSLDVLVNNAGIVVGGVLEAVPLDDLRHQLEVNVVGQVAVTQAFLPALRASRGRVVFVSSISGRVSAPVMTPYTASKHGLEAIADGLRVELRPWGIGVVLVEPGSIDTDIWRGAGSQLDSTIAAMSPEHRELYDPLLRGAGRIIRATARRAAPLDEVTAAIERAATADRPRPRYVVGKDARVQLALHRLLPTRAMDALFARASGTP